MNAYVTTTADFNLVDCVACDKLVCTDTLTMIVTTYKDGAEYDYYHPTCYAQLANKPAPEVDEVIYLNTKGTAPIYHAPH